MTKQSLLRKTKYLLVYRDMSKIDEIINFLINDLNIKISKTK